MPNHATKTSFKKGQSGNPNGGKKNRAKKVKAWELMEAAIIGKHTDKANEILDELEGKEFFDAFCKLLEYFKPKIGRSEIEMNVKVGLQPIVVKMNIEPLIETEKANE